MSRSRAIAPSASANRTISSCKATAPSSCAARTRASWSHARTLFNADAVVNVGGALSLSVGSKEKPKPVEGQLSGDLAKGGGAIELSAAKGVRLRVGKTVIVIGP